MALTDTLMLEIHTAVDMAASQPDDARALRTVYGRPQEKSWIPLSLQSAKAR